MNFSRRKRMLHWQACFWLWGSFFFFGIFWSRSAVEAQLHAHQEEHYQQDHPSIESLYTAEERELLKKYPVVRVGIDPDWPPFSFRDEKGQYQGLDLDLLKLLSRRTGIKFEVGSGGSWNEVLQSAREGKYDILSSTAMTEERKIFFIFSEPYFNFVTALITRYREPFLVGLNQLEGRRVASPREHVTTDMLRLNHPELNILETDSTMQSLEMVSRGQADATVAQLAHASYLIREQGLTNLKVSGILDRGYDLRFAIRPDWQEFQALLNKAIGSVSEQEKAVLLGKWIHVDREPWLTWRELRTYVLGLILLLLVVGTALIVINIIQRREISRRMRVELELKAAGQNLLRVNEEKNKMMQMLAHDLRSPLTGIMAASDMLKLELKDKEAAGVLGSLDEISALSDRINKMVGQLLTVSALESGVQTLKPESIDLVQVVKKIVEVQRSQSARKNTAIELSAPENPCMIHCDQLALESIMDNLLSNAVKFSPPASVVEILVEKKEASVVLKVRDHGPGFTEKDKTSLFKKFTHLSARPTSGETSTGLGLAIVKALVVALKGDIRCESQVGQGATFVVTLPA
jgi:signal transduction histidine kinase